MTIAIAIHGGAGVLRADKLGARHRAVLKQALEAGYDILKRGETSLDAVAAAVVVLEDSPLFNAGRGSSFNSVGEKVWLKSTANAELCGALVMSVCGLAAPPVSLPTKRVRVR